MKYKLLKYIGLPLFLFVIWLFIIAANLNPNLKFFQFRFDGAWLPSVNDMAVGPNNYTTLKNMRYKDGGYLETVEGYSKITSSTVSASGTPTNLHHFVKEGETHVIAKMTGVSGSSYLYENTTSIPDTGDFGAAIYTVSDGLGSFVNGPAGVMLYVDDQYDLVWGGDEMRPARVFGNDSYATPEVNLQEYTSNVTNDKTTDSMPIDTNTDRLYICSPYKLDGIKIYLENANTTTGTVVDSAFWAGGGSAWDAMAGFTDNTESGGKTLAVDGTMTWTYDEDQEARYFGGGVYYVYRIAFDTGVAADIYKITMSAPMQQMRDVWNQSGRTCTAFQANRDGVYEDYTFPVNDYSSADSVYAAKIGDIDDDDKIYVMFDDRVIGINITMVAGATNQVANVEIDAIKYWDGTAYAAVGDYYDDTDIGTSISLAKSGTVFWDSPDSDSEHAQDLFGKHGYVYEIDFNGTLTAGTDYNGTMIDFIEGIAAQLDVEGYDVAGHYSNRAVLFQRNRMDYSRSGLPWVFNGTDTSDDGRLSLYFGEETNVTAVASLYNRYGSRIIESLIVCKTNETYLLTGSQPYIDYAEPFVIKKVSGSIGCPAPNTLKVIDIGSEIAKGDWRNGAIWMDSTGPVMFAGETIRRLDGLEKWFDPNLSTCIRHSYIENATAYIDWTNKEYNLIFTQGVSATYNNYWVVYDLERRKWYQKSAAWYPNAAATVIDEYGTKYNYSIGYDRHMRRMDHGQTYGGTAISQQITTGEFLVPTLPNDSTGFWGFSEIMGIKVLSADVDEDVNLTVSTTYDGSSHSPDLTVDLNATGDFNYTRNKKDVNRVGAQGYTFQVDFSADTNTTKWAPLMWGFKARSVRED